MTNKMEAPLPLPNNVKVNTTTTNTSKGRGDGGGRERALELGNKLRTRGVVTQLDALMVFASPEAIEGAIAWWDSQQPGAGPGVLVATIRAGGKPGWQPPKPRRQNDIEYARQVVDWLRQHFPEWNCETGNRTHSAAIAAVMRLHHQHGRMAVTVSEHGSQIRQAVEDFEERFCP